MESQYDFLHMGKRDVIASASVSVIHHGLPNGLLFIHRQCNAMKFPPVVIPKVDTEAPLICGCFAVDAVLDHELTPFTFSKVRSVPMPSIVITTVISGPKSNDGTVTVRCR